MARIKKYTPEEAKLVRKAADERYRQKHKDKIKEKAKILRESNPDKCKEYRDKHKENNSDKRKEYGKIYRKKNYLKAKEYHKLWTKRNIDKVNFTKAKRRSSKLKATPNWMTEKDWMEIRRFYKVASFLRMMTGIDYCVDHIHPLQGESICGLHVPWNLQILTKSQNASKGIQILPIE